MDKNIVSKMQKLTLKFNIKLMHYWKINDETYALFWYRVENELENIMLIGL